MDRHAWEQPGAHEEAPGIYRIPLPLPGDHLKAVNVYAVADGDRVVMIDGGWALADATDLLTRSLASIGYALADIREFLVTHIHRDHYTQAVAVRRLVGSTVSVGEGEQIPLEALRNVRVHPDIKAMYAAGAFELSAELQKWTESMGDAPDLTDWEDPDRWLPDGLDIPLTTRTLRVVATPGHTRGHVVYHDPEHNVLFAGDHVLPHITPSIGIEIARKPSPLRDYLSSLKLTRELPDARLLPAHGPVVESVHDRVDELIAHHARRLDATRGTIDRGAHTAFEIASALPWTRRERRFTELDMFNQIMAINETVAHLEVLRERDLVSAETLDGVVHWTLTGR